MFFRSVSSFFITVLNLQSSQTSCCLTRQRTINEIDPYQYRVQINVRRHFDYTEIYKHNTCRNHTFFYNIILFQFTTDVVVCMSHNRKMGSVL